MDPSPGGRQNPSLVLLLAAHSNLSPGLPTPAPPDLASLLQPPTRTPPARYPGAPLPPLLGRESDSGRPRILLPRPASRASHPLARDPRGEGRRLEGSKCRVHLRWGGCRRDRDASRGNLVQTLQNRAPSLATRWAGSGEKSGRGGRGSGVVA